MPTDENPYSVQISYFGLKARAQVGNWLAKLVKQANGAQKVSNDFARFNMSAYKAAK